MLAASINAATLSLIDAGIAMYDYVCAITAGYINQEIILGKLFTSDLY
jgi:exosome complex component RRP41